MLRKYKNALEDWIEARKTEAKLLDACLKLNIDHVVDVGANHGAIYDKLRKGGYGGRYTAVEPNPALARTLSDKLAADAKADVVEAAVSDQNGTATLYVDPQFDVLSSLNHAGPDMNTGVALAPAFEVKTLTTAALLDQCSPVETTRFLLKVDTQGHDANVLRGLGDAWSRVHFVMTELSAIPLYQDQAPHWDVLRMLDEQGFVPIRYHTITRRRERDIVLIAEYDGLFVRR